MKGEGSQCSGRQDTTTRKRTENMEGGGGARLQHVAHFLAGYSPRAIHVEHVENHCSPFVSEARRGAQHGWCTYDEVCLRGTLS